MTSPNQTQQASAPSAAVPAPFDELNRQLIWPLGLLAGSAGLVALASVYQAAVQFSWQAAVVAAAFAITGLAALDGWLRCRKRTYQHLRLALPEGSLVIALLLSALLINRAALPAAFFFLAFSLVETSITSSYLPRSNITMVVGLVLSVVTALAGTFLTGLYVPSAWAAQVIPVLLGLAAAGFFGLLGLRITAASLQIRLIVAFLAILMVPLTLTSFFQNQIALTRIRSETYNGLTATAAQVALVLDKFINNNLDAIRQEADQDALSVYLSDPAGSAQDSEQQRNMQTVINLLVTRETDERKALSSYSLLDQNGVIVYATDAGLMGQSDADAEHFRQPFETGRPYFSPLEFDGQGNGFAYFAAPVKSTDRMSIVGVLVAKYSASVFQRLAVNYAGLYGTDSHVLIIDENMLRVADTYHPELVYRTIEDLSSTQIQTMQASQRLPIHGVNPAGAVSPELARLLRSAARSGTVTLELEGMSAGETALPEVTAYASMQQLPWKVVYLMAINDQRPTESRQAQAVILIASLASLVVGLTSLEASRFLATPISNLTRAAEKIATGDLSVRAAETGGKEIGTLAKAFNQMTARLDRFIQELENRVKQRTEELERRNQSLSYRSSQLQTVAEVARSIVTAQELQPLLETVTHVISERFGFYHVGIFLLDEKREFALLRAANSAGGQRMLARSHRLPVGRVGIVGYVTGTGEARVTTDVGEDAVFFNNPDLPQTRSEMALPLKIGDEIIGALDVQSTVSDAFSHDDIELFSTLADQVAVAIYNNRLYGETARALAESQAVHRQYLRQEWSADLAARRRRAYRYSAQGTATEHSLLDDQPIETGEVQMQASLQPDGTTRLELLVPILIRGENIGVIRLLDQAERSAWSEDELLAVRDVAGQVGAALETARLFEKTSLRAERERKVLEITGRIRAVNDPQQMLDIAAAELQKTLGVTRAQVTLHPQPGPPP